MKPRRSFNPKRQIREPEPAEVREALALRVRYGGNPEHKRNPGDFGLIPPAAPRPGKTLCDGAGVLTQAEALTLLMEGVRRGLVSVREVNGWPQNIWAVQSAEGRIALEAMLENSETGTYHGYPMQEGDPLAEEVVRRWFGVSR